MQAIEHQGETLTYLTVEPDDYRPETPYPLVILMHGFGSNMGDLASLAPAINRTGYVYAFPNAPIRMEMGFGAEGYAWTSLSGGDRTRLAALAEKKLSGFFEEVLNPAGVGPRSAVLGGFSQGGMMAYRLGLESPHAFKGLAILSSRLDGDEHIPDKKGEGPEQSIFISHGTQDTMIPVEDGRRARSLLTARGYAPEYREYEMGHEISAEVLADFREWLHRVLPPATLQQGN